MKDPEIEAMKADDENQRAADETVEDSNLVEVKEPIDFTKNCQRCGEPAQFHAQVMAAAEGGSMFLICPNSTFEPYRE